MTEEFDAEIHELLKELGAQLHIDSDKEMELYLIKKDLVKLYRGRILVDKQKLILLMMQGQVSKIGHAMAKAIDNLAIEHKLRNKYD